MTIIITGTSTGIGFALAEYFGKKGHKIFGLSRKNVKSQYFTSIPTDITDNTQVQAAISEILKTESRIDVLINNIVTGNGRRCRKFYQRRHSEVIQPEFSWVSANDERSNAKNA